MFVWDILCETRVWKRWQLESVAIANASHSALFLYCAMRACAQTRHIFQHLVKFDIAISFSDPDFLKESNNVAIRWRFDIDLWHLTLKLVVYRLSQDQTLYQLLPKSNNPPRTYWWLSKLLLWLSYAVTLTFDPLTLNFCTRLYLVSRVQTVYKIWAKLDDPSLSYWRFSTFCSSILMGSIPQWCLGRTVPDLERTYGHYWHWTNLFSNLGPLGNAGRSKTNGVEN